MFSWHVKQLVEKAGVTEEGGVYEKVTIKRHQIPLAFLSYI